MSNANQPQPMQTITQIGVSKLSAIVVSMSSYDDAPQTMAVVLALLLLVQNLSSDIVIFEPICMKMNMIMMITCANK